MKRTLKFRFIRDVLTQLDCATVNHSDKVELKIVAKFDKITSEAEFSFI